MIEQNQTHNKIIEFLKQKGPSLPIQIAKEIGMGSLFISAFLSELAQEKRIKVSHLKVGGSPLYFLNEQEEKLENFYKYLHPKEAEAFLLLKKNKVLKDSDQEPAIRVALRSIRDFAIGFKQNNEIYWRYMLVPETEIKITKKSKKQPIKLKKQKLEKTKKTSLKQETSFQNPLIIKQKTKKEKQKTDFVLKTIQTINNNFKIIKEKDHKPKEYNCIIQIKSELGIINFLTQAKDKKKISEADLKKLLSNAQKIPIPALFLFTGDLSKKAKEFAEKYSSILKVRKIE